MKTKLTALLLFLSLSGFSGVMAQPPDASRPIEENERAALFPSQSMLQQGQSVAEAACAKCHGLAGISNDPDVPHLAGQRAIYLYRVLTAYQNGYRIDQSMGHAGGFLNDDGLLSVAAYYANQNPMRIDPPEEDQSNAGPAGSDPFASIRKDLKNCTKCHNEDGNSTASGMPNLTAQSPEVFEASMLAYTEGGRQHKMMQRLVSRLDAETIRLMGVYYAVQEPVATPKPGDGDEAAGRMLAEACDICHGENGNTADPKVPTLAGQDPKYFIKAMDAYKSGERKHQGMFDAVDGLSEQDILDMATFYAARTPVGREVRAPLTTTEWIDRCARCHGLDGNSTDARFPMLAGQNRAYLEQSLQAYAQGQRGSTTMHAMSAPLTAADVETIAAYYSGRQPKSVVYIDLPCE